MQSILVQGRPPSSPPSNFNRASKLFAAEETCGTKTTISAYTSTVQELTATRFSDLQPVVIIRLKTHNDAAPDREDIENDDNTPGPEDGENATPWVAQSPYYMTWWDSSQVRIDSEEDPAFWCVCPVELLPTRME